VLNERQAGVAIEGVIRHSVNRDDGGVLRLSVDTHGIRRHFDGIVAWTQSRQTNGYIEAINGLFQAAKRKARGYARFETMRTVLFLVAGKLDFSRFNENAR
jgi:hypothetical protein